jgi:hypothetical protein
MSLYVLALPFRTIIADKNVTWNFDTLNHLIPRMSQNTEIHCGQKPVFP